MHKCSTRRGASPGPPHGCWGGFNHRVLPRLPWLVSEDGERLRGTERDWDGGDEQGHHGGPPGGFIGLEVVENDDERRRQAAKIR
jgi:hypothetical protein